MRTTRVSLIVLCTLCSLIPVALYSDGLGNNEVAFTGRVSSATLDGSGGGTLFVQMSTFDLRVLVNARTRITDGSGYLVAVESLADLVKLNPPVVEVTGKYSSSGTLATGIRVLDSTAANAFKVSGHVTGIQASGSTTVLSLLGLRLVVSEGLKISWDGADFPLADLKVGMVIEANGSIAVGAGGNIWNVEALKTLSEGGKRESLQFEGTVLSYDTANGVLAVAVAGAPTNETKVLVTKSTKIYGEIKEGVYVRVTGALNPGLGATADSVEVVPPVELKPDARKLKVGETAVFTASMRVPTTQDVEVKLSADPVGVLELPVATVKILKDGHTADLSVKALKLGLAILTAAVGTDKATAEVRVAGVSDVENDVPSRPVRIYFAPDHIKMEPGETREVVLLINPAQKEPVTVTLTPLDESIAKVARQQELGGGTASLKIAVQALTAGTSSVIATLPPELGKGEADLLIDVGAKGGVPEKPLALAFRPAKLNLKVNETRPVEVRLSSPVAADIQVVLSQEDGTPVKVPSDPLAIEAGKISASFNVEGLSVGESRIRAAFLLSSVGSATAVLDVEVKK